MSSSGECQTVLVVDDNRLSVQILAATAEREGFAVCRAYDGDQALALLAEREIDILITDWEMPGRSGLELVEAVRSGSDRPYCYIIMVTQHDDSDHRALGLKAGADDFLSKPVTDTEVTARLRVGRRIVAMSRSLRAQRDELAAAQARMCTELQQAARVQRSLLPRKQPELPGWSVAWRLQPSDELAGDSLGLVRLAPRRLGAYLFDVSGHGVTAALLATQVSRALSADPDAGSVLFERDGSDHVPAQPSAVLGALNRRFQMDREVPQLVAMSYALFDLDQGAVTWASAAIPPPYLVSADGCRERVERVDPFLGMLPDSVFHDHHASLASGERLVLTSDGFDEALGADNEQFGTDRVAQQLAATTGRPLDQAIDDLLMTVSDWTTAGVPVDDRAVLALERR